MYALVLCVVYWVIERGVPASVIRRGASDHQVNYIRVEQVVYSEPTPRFVVLGSSIAGVLRSEQLGKDFGLVAIGRGCADTGLEILSRKGVVPKCVIIEANMLGKGVDEEMVGYFCSSISSHLRDYCSPLRQSGQPINLLISIVQHFKRTPNRVVDKNVLAVNLERFERIYSHAPELNDWNSKIIAVRERALQLQRLGARIVFVEFPIDTRLEGTQFCEFVRNDLHAKFPTNQFEWITPSRNEAWTTTDGVHMTSESAYRFAEWIKNRFMFDMNK